MKEKSVLVVGLGISGIASVRALNNLGAKVSAYDIKDRKDMEDIVNDLSDISITYYFNTLEFNSNDFDFVIKSPGIDFDTPIMKKLTNDNMHIIGDLEAGYLISKNKFITITGTNGKTTTTTLVGKIIDNSGIDSIVTGNIGSGVFFDSFNAKNDELMVVEASSFQLESTYTFKPYISVITNLTPDHINWHKSEENYYKAKFKVAQNQDLSDFCILNYDDENIKKYIKNINTNICYFSSDEILDEGIYVENDYIVFNYNNKYSKILNINDIFIPGRHNIQNVLVACAIGKLLNINDEIIKNTITNFKGVEHRLEYVNTYKGVKFYNDSKGTNPDSSIKAIEGVKKPIILIAGGYDKNSNYDEFIESFGDKVKDLILLGATKEKIKGCALKHNFNSIHMVENMDEAVKKSFELMESGDTVLLSPACASWGMYPNYEVRGKDFKERVKFYGENKKK